MLIIDQQNLADLLGEAVYNANAILVELNGANLAVAAVTDPDVIRANYRALSQIFDDLVRIHDTTDTIHTSLTRKAQG